MGFGQCLFCLEEMDEMVDMDVDDNCKVVVRAATRSSKEDVDRSSELGQM